MAWQAAINISSLRDCGEKNILLKELVLRCAVNG